MRSKETECRLTRRSSSRIRKVSSEQTILSDVACTAARSSGGRPRRCLERLRTPFDDHIRGFCRARATNNRTRQSEGTTAAVMRQKQACRRYNSLRSRSLSRFRGYQIECPDRRFSLSASLLLRAFEIIASGLPATSHNCAFGRLNVTYKHFSRNDLKKTESVVR